MHYKGQNRCLPEMVKNKMRCAGKLEENLVEEKLTDRVSLPTKWKNNVQLDIQAKASVHL